MDKLLTEGEVEHALRYRPGTLRTKRHRHTSSIPFIRLDNGHIRYRQSDVEQWLANQVVKL